jgi:cell division protein FtsW (lipid II flippase)
MEKKNPWEFFNRPPVMIALAIFAVVCGFLKWIDWSYVVVCVGAAIVGVVIAIRKKKVEDVAQR